MRRESGQLAVTSAAIQRLSQLEIRLRAAVRRTVGVALPRQENNPSKNYVNLSGWPALHQ
jgi:hypothetical protein